MPLSKITVTVDPSKRVMTAFVNTFDMLSDEELSKYPGQDLDRNNFDNHILTAIHGVRTVLLYTKDGASDDVGPVELGGNEDRYCVNVSGFDFSASNCEEQLAEILRQVVRNEIEADLESFAECQAAHEEYQRRMLKIAEQEREEMEH